MNIVDIAATTTGAGVTLEKLNTDYVFEQIISNRTGDTYDTVIQHSADGTNWHTLVTFTQVAAGTDATELKFPTTAVLGHVRAVCTLGGAGDADIVVNIHYK